MHVLSAAVNEFVYILAKFVTERYPYAGEKFKKQRGKFKAKLELVYIHKE
jgi:hypothetical protein